MRKKTFILIALIIFFGILTGLSAMRKIHAAPREKSSSSELEELRSLPYATWSEGEVKDAACGVIKYNPDKLFSGYNLYTDIAKHAFLMDMNGKILYRWEFPFEGKWEYYELLDNADIVAFEVGKNLIKMNRNSKVIWLKNIPATHDIEVLADGTYLVIGDRRVVNYNSRKVKFDSILHVSASGRILDEWSTYKNFKELKKFHPKTPLDRKEKGITQQVDDKGSPFVYYHVNSIQVIPKTNLGIKDKRFREGNYLICLRNTDLIVILDKDTKKVVWAWGPGVLDWPHMPTMLENGNILIFDNGFHREYSRVIEINPLDSGIVWEYKADPPENFHSVKRGSSQRLANGNTLICESDKGHVFEVTRQGEVVWEFLNPEIKDGERKIIYRMIRIPKEKVEDWLENRDHK